MAKRKAPSRRNKEVKPDASAEADIDLQQGRLLPVPVVGGNPLTLWTLMDSATFLENMGQMPSLQQSSDKGYELWRRLSTAHVTVCTAHVAADLVLISVRHFVTKRFGGCDLAALNRVTNWLVAEQGMTRDQAEALPLPELYGKLRMEDGAAVEPEIARRVKRLVFDDDTLTVTLDSEDYAIKDPRTYFLYKTIAQEENPPITNARISAQVPGLRGKGAIPSRLKTLPAALRNTIQTNTSGHYLRLPPPKKSSR